MWSRHEEVTARRYLQKLNLPLWIERKNFFLFRDHGGSDFQKNNPWPCKIGMKNEEETLFLRSHLHADGDLQKKNFTLFPICVRPVASTLFQMWPFEWKVCPTLIWSMDARPKSYNLNSAPTSHVMMSALFRFLMDHACCLGTCLTVVHTQLFCNYSWSHYLQLYNCLQIL